MPPLRTFPPVKAVKTERTHEENQERAYIAASRRSDRSLEARVESARRASEIHKRRTGRSLRVTEQDVINEEMYEEEDDDLPSQYRRLTAHLQTGSADFNRRLAAYLTNNVAMRSALDQAITSSYAQQFPNAPRFAHNNPVPFPSPLSTQGHGTMNPSASQQSPQSPHPYRQSPYPMAGMAGYRQHSQHQRTHSMNTGDQKPQNVSAFADRRTSMPTPVLSPSKGTDNSMSPPQVKDAPVSPSSSKAIASKPPQEQNVSSYAQGISPLTTTLPTESQMLLGNTLDTTSPFNSMLMGGNDHSSYIDNDFFGTSSKESNFYPNLDGMNTTLAPSVNLSMQASFEAFDSHGRQSGGPFDNALNFDNLKGHDFITTSDSGSGNATPGIDGTWETFIDDSSSWAENAT